MALLLALLLSFDSAFWSCLAQDKQAEAPSFGKTERVAAAVYTCRAETAHSAEALEMGRAGIDVAAVALEGPIELLDALVAALDELDRQSRDHPRLAPYVRPGVALDLSSAAAFWDHVPARHQARLDGRPILWLGPAPPGVTPDRAAFELALGRLSKPVYLIADLSWKEAPAERTWAAGLTLDLPIVTVGPGGGNRDDGKVYERLWYKALKLEPKMVVIETWNGTADGVSETPDRKRKYLDETKRRVRDFKVDTKSVLPKGKWTSEKQVAFTTKYQPHEQGLRAIALEDGPFELVRLYGFSSLTTKELKGSPVRKLGFDVDDSFSFFERKPFEVALEFLDLGEGEFRLEYDSFDRTIPAAERIVKKAGTGRFTGTGEWRTELFSLPDAAFGNGQPGGSDFRIVVERRGIAVRSVMVLRK